MVDAGRSGVVIECIAVDAETLDAGRKGQVEEGGKEVDRPPDNRVPKGSGIAAIFLLSNISLLDLNKEQKAERRRPDRYTIPYSLMSSA